MPEAKVERAKVADESPSFTQRARPTALADLALNRTRPRASNLLIGDYTSQNGYAMKVERREEASGKYDFIIKDRSGAITLESTAQNFTDMSMVIEVWQMKRADAPI